mmetsp:Transcript_44728/g.78751  ORF Transcript_44728/g.78751 Transcript_44728/m.78751 type:complete len:687 (+) Transcript_44728:177-2237(+)
MAIQTFAHELVQSLFTFDDYSEVAADFFLYAFFIVAALAWSRACPPCMRVVRSCLSHGKDESKPDQGFADIPTGEQFNGMPQCPEPPASFDEISALASESQQGAPNSVADSLEAARETFPDTFDGLCTWPKELEEEPVAASMASLADSIDDLCTWPVELEGLPAKTSKETMDIWMEPSDALYLFENGDTMNDPWPSEAALPRFEEAAAEDACNVLEAAMSSGDPKLAESALAAGMRLCNAAWLAKACEGFLEAGIPLDSQQLTEVMHAFGNENRADLAVDLWQAACRYLYGESEQAEFSDQPPAADLYGAALEACARCGDFDTAARAVSSAGWRSPSCKFGQDALLALARWFARRQDVVRALDSYNAVRRARGGSDLATHRAVLIASVRSADMAQAEDLFQDLKASGLVPDGPSLSAMICGHCAAGNVEKAMSYFSHLKRCGIAPSAPLFDAILDGCAWMNMPSLMEQVLADMEAAGVRPSTSTLTILLRNYGSNGDTERALAVFEELPKRHGFELDGPAYGALISVCLSNGCFGVGWSAFEKMSESGRVAHARTYEALITSCLRQGHLEHAVRVIDEALNLTSQPRAQAHDESQDVPLSGPPRVRLEKKVVEEVLRVIGRRRASARLGAPLLARLQAARVEVSDALVEAIQRSSSAEAEPSSAQALGSVLKQRQAQLARWRNFQA